MNARLYALLAALLGIATGFITIHSFFAHSWTSMILWVAVGIAVVYRTPNLKAAMYAGAAFGFFDILLWLAFGFQGASNQVRGFTILALVLSIVGSICGAVGAFLYYRLFCSEKIV